MASISLSTRLEFQKVELEKKSVVHLLVNLKAQPFTPKDRKPLSIAAVIDVSGSMAGDKVDYAKKTLRELARHMTGDDTLSISAFSDEVWSVIPSTRMDQAGREKAAVEIDKLVSLSATNLSGATVEGWERVKDAPGSVARVILFTDGQPTCGITDKGQIVQIAGKRPSEKASLTTMGFGQDCDRELLGQMAKAGGGNFYFINTLDECLSIFGAELGGLLSCVAQQIKVKVDVEKDVKILEVLNDFDVEADDKGGRWATISVGDAYAEETRKILLKLELPSVGRTLGARPIHVATVRNDFFDVLANENRWEEAKVKVEFVPASEAQKDPDLEVKEQVAILAAAKAQKEAQRLAEAHDWKGSQSMVMMAIAGLKDVGTEATYALAKDLDQNVMQALAGEHEYRTAGGSHYMYSNSMSYGRGRASNKKMSETIGSSLQKASMKSFENAVDQIKEGSLTQVNPPVKEKPVFMENTKISKKKNR